MINENDDLIYIQDEEGKETPYKILKDFYNEDNSKHFLFYMSIEDDAEEVMVGLLNGEIDGEGEILEVESEEDMKFCEEVFEEFLNELDADALEEEDEEEIENA